MISLIDKVGNALHEDIALQKLLSNRIYWIRPADDPTYPYVTYFEVTNTEAESADDEEYADEVEIQVDIWTKGSTITIAKEVQRIMRKLGFRHQALADDYDPDTKIIHKPIRFFITQEI